MKNIILSILAIATISLSSFGQAPEGFKYQAVIRDASNLILTSQAVGVQLTIQQGSIGGTVVYTETFAPTTNSYGLVNLEIGTGTTLDDFALIDWSAGPYFMETAIDITGGTSYSVMGTSQLMSVPYALHANTAENVTNDLVDDADADAMNEIQDLQLLGNILMITNNGTATSIDLSGYLDNTDTQLDETAVDAFVSNNGYITSPDDADADPNNEIQTISRTGTTVILSNGGGTFEDSVGVYTAGAGIDITGNVVSTTEPTYTIGLWPELGGYIFRVSADGKHGLVAETVDQDYTLWYEAQNSISNPSNHSIDGQKFSDWRMPTKYELNEMYVQQAAIGGFTLNYYWSSTEFDFSNAWIQLFATGNQSNYDKSGPTNLYVRAVRAF